MMVIKERLTVESDNEVIGQFLLDVGTVLQEIATNLEQGLYPHDKCAIMAEYFNNLKSVLNGKVKDILLDKLQNLIEESYRVEKLLGELNQLDDSAKKYNINMLRTASGNFIGLGKLYKIGGIV